MARVVRCSQCEKIPDDFPPVMIFLGVNIPLMNGFEFLNEFSKPRSEIDEATAVVVMMFTSSAREQEKEPAFSFEFVKDFFSKGEFTSQELQEKLLALAQ